MTGRFEGKTVVVTGGARGIGEAIVRSFIVEGARAVVLDIADPAEALAGARYLRTDISDRDSVVATFREIGATDGRVDVLVNNAGVQHVDLIDKLDPALWAKVLGVHINGTYYCSAAAIPLMKRNRSGSIVTIASVAAYLGLPGRGAYSTSKAGMLGLTRVMAVELADAGIRVNAVAPGFARTPLVEQAIRNGSLQEAWMLDQIPMRRLATPDEIAKVVRFLASDDASYITGQCLVVDGGWTIQGIGGRPDWLASGSQNSDSGMPTGRSWSIQGARLTGED